MLFGAAIVAALAATATAQNVPVCALDSGNGVHVPGAIPANLYEPLQHRLAYAGTGMTVSWSSFEHLETPQVMYGTDPSNLDCIANSTLSTTYPTSRTYNNHVKLDNLKPATKYWYKVSYTNAAYAAYRPLYTFTTAREAGDHTPFAIASFADLGLMGHDGLSTRAGPLGGDENSVLGANETNTIQSLLASKDSFEFMAHYGDIGYADYFLRESAQGYFGNDTETRTPDIATITTRYESLSEQFFDQLSPITAEKPWMVSPGNHEANCINGGYSNDASPNNLTGFDCPVGQSNFTFYIEHYKMPSWESGGRNNFWYSYDYGMAHFISLDTETDLGHGLVGPIEDKKNNDNGPFGLMDEQVNWLIQDLEKVDRKKTPWVVVGLHRPWYTSVSPPTYPAWQEAFEKIFFDYGVDIYLSGHVHVYERFSPMFNGTVDPNGMNNPRAPWPVLNGAAGHYDGLDVFDDVRSNGSMFGIDDVYGWGRMKFHNRTHLTYEYVAAANSSVVDSATLYKAHEF